MRPRPAPANRTQTLKRAAPRPAASTGRSRYGRRRAATLAGVYVLMGLHIAHWRISGKTLAPLELNEVMYTLELGIITAGFLFMLTACVATLIFGRYFCGWGCHILALEDLCTWLLKKLRIRPKPVRSRLLLLVPVAAMFYMFVWPQATRLAQGRPLPVARVQTDVHGWASFQTSDFWRNLPSPGVALLTFAICGFVIVYVLGSRSFCAYGCPYGALFRGLDRLAPGRIVATGDCSNCGACTAVCPSHVLVHKELQQFGTVVNPACVKDLECVSACPDGIVKYGLARPPLLRGWSAWRPLRQPFDFHWAEELLIASVLLATLLAFRGLYDLVPFLMTLGLGAILACLAVSVARVAYRSDVRFGHLWVKQAGRLTRTGVGVLALALNVLAFSAHCAWIRYHEYFGYRAAALSPQAAALDGAVEHLEVCRQWGLVCPPRLPATLARLYATRGARRADAGDVQGALADLSRAVRAQPDAAELHYNYGVLLAAAGREEEALRSYRSAAALEPTDADVHNNLGFLLARRQEWREAEGCFTRALAHNPNHADAHFNLARLLIATARPAQAAAHLDAAARLDSRYAAIRAELEQP